MANRDELKKWLRENSTPEEIEELDRLDEKEAQDGKLENIEKGVNDFNGKTHDLLSTVVTKINKVVESSPQQNQMIVEAFAKIAESLNQRLDELKTVTKNNKTADLSGFFKDFGTQIGQWAESSKNSEDLIRNLKWNASQQLRDVNGSPINPSIAPFAITVAYDDIKLTYTGSNITQVDYYQTNMLKATLVLTYDGSSNLTDVQRTH